MSKTMKVHIDITDWRDDVLRDENVVKDDEQMLDLINQGKSTSYVAKSAVVSREMKEAADDVLRPNKLLYLSGAMTDVSNKVAMQKHLVETDDGAAYEVRDYVGNSGGDDELPKGYVTSKSDDGMERACSYLENVVPGHVWNRLVIVYENSGDVVRAAETLMHKIDKMVSKLS